MEPMIRRAGHADGQAIARLRREWTEEQQDEGADRDFEQRFAAWYARESARRVTWLAEVDGRVVGMMNLAVFERMPRPGHPASYWGYLGNAFVLAEHRNKGIGRRLIDAAVDHAARNDFARVVVSPSERSIPFYERAGFGPADVLMVRGRGHAG
jgi:GNAT superfamily N-acetyltransferase